MENPLVSILIVTYNAEKTIWWTLTSIFDQTYKNYEILILDNNSTDKTIETINDMAEFKKEDIGEVNTDEEEVVKDIYFISLLI